MLNWQLIPNYWWRVSHAKIALFLKSSSLSVPILLPTFHFLMVFGMMFPTTNEENLSAEALT